ncbi:MAG: response regulator [Deltaproteobacteria bacterium]|nr:response regulator [Deltaproteobacteria bacterium]
MAAPYIMLVDDEAAFVDTMIKRLQKRGFSAISAGSGSDALDLLKTNQNLDVILLDVKMPGMDGIETLHEIKKRYPLIEVVMLTGHATIESAIEGMKAGAFDYLMKPCDIDKLVEKVMEAADKRREHAEKIEKAQLEKIMTNHGV